MFFADSLELNEDTVSFSSLFVMRCHVLKVKSSVMAIITSVYVLPFFP
jgi:hypothetical protein